MSLFSSSPKVPEILPEEVKKMMDSKESFLLLDVRTSGEYTRGKIPGSIHIPLDQISSEVFKKIPDKKTKIVVYCLSGSRSIHAVDMLMKLGYEQVSHMPNGLLAWRIHQYPFEMYT